MRAVTASLACLLATSCGQAQEPRIHRTEIYSGGTRTVGYSGTGLSAGEMRSLREMERLENEAAFLRDLGALKREYVAGERLMDPYRRLTQQALYGFDMAVYAPAYAAYPYGWGYPAASYAPSLPYGAAVARGLAGGVGDEGSLKAMISGAIARQSGADYAIAVERAYDLAAARSSSSPVLRAAWDPRPDRGGVRPAAGEESPVVLTLKDGEKVRGLKAEEKGGWFIVTLPGERQVRIRESEVLRIETGPGGGVKPAGG